MQTFIIIAYFNNLTTQLLYERFESKAFIAPLGAREKEVFRFIAYGYSNKKIADV
jgi:DNA-binding NarL/FixJ family response regulator